MKIPQEIFFSNQLSWINSHYYFTMVRRGQEALFPVLYEIIDWFNQVRLEKVFSVSSKLLAAVNALRQVPAKEGCAESLGFLFFSSPLTVVLRVGTLILPGPVQRTGQREEQSSHQEGQEVLPSNCSKTGVCQFGQCCSDSQSRGRRLFAGYSFVCYRQDFFYLLRAAY